MEWVPQLYRTSYASFASELAEVERGLANAPGAALVVGLRCNGAGSPTAWNELEAMLARCQKDRVGVAVWYLVCLTYTYKEKNFTLGNTPLNQT